MVNHIVLWNFNETLTEEQKAEAGRRIKESLEAIKEKAQGVISLEVRVNELTSSNKDIALLSSCLLYTSPSPRDS